MAGTNSSDSLFGWDFQINAAIVLMLENVAEVNKVRVEGATEDIEITTTDGGKVYSQAKSFVDPTNSKNSRQKLTAGLTTLNGAAKDKNSVKLVYITNSNNPLNDKGTMSIFYGDSRRSYNSLPHKAKEVVDKILKAKSLSNIDKSKLWIYVLPFETDDTKERYKVILDKVKQFIADIRTDHSGIAGRVLDIWQKQLFDNATFHDTEIVLSKEDLMWPLIVVMVDSGRNRNPFTEEIEDGTYNEVIARFKTFLDCRSQKFTFTTKVISDYQSKKSQLSRGNQGVIDFVNSNWQNYTDEFISDAPDEIIESLIKITLYNVIQQQYFIAEVKAKVAML